MATPRILRVEPRYSGHTRVTFDLEVDVRPVLVVLTEQAHTVLPSDPGRWIAALARDKPRRGSRL